MTIPLEAIRQESVSPELVLGSCSALVVEGPVAPPLLSLPKSRPAAGTSGKEVSVFMGGASLGGDIATTSSDIREGVQDFQSVCEEIAIQATKDNVLMQAVVVDQVNGGNSLGLNGGRITRSRARSLEEIKWTPP